MGVSASIAFARVVKVVAACDGQSVRDSTKGGRQCQDTLYWATTHSRDLKLKEIPELIKKHRAQREEMGIRLVGTWSTMGEYDFVSVYDAPDDQTMAASLLMTGMAGLVRTRTMRALSEEEFAQVLSKLP